MSTRKVDDLVRAMGIDGISKSQVSELARSLDEMVEAFRSRPPDAEAYPRVWLDALPVKCREHGRVVNVACVVAIGVRDDGHREVLGVDVFTTEDGLCPARGSMLPTMPSVSSWAHPERNDRRRARV